MPGVSRPGDQFAADVPPDLIDKAAAMNMAAGEHLWLIIAGYGLTNQEAARAHEGLTQLLDRDHLLTLTPIGCYICEQPYGEVATKKCKGEPLRYGPDGPVYKDGSTG